VIPIGAKNVTNDLAIGLRISLESAEKVKLFLSKADKDKQSKKAPEEDSVDLSHEGVEEIKKVSRKTLVEGIIRPRLNEIFTMVGLELEKVGLASSIPSGVIVTGGGAETVGVVESAKRTLALPVRIGIPRGVGGLVDDILTPSFAVPVGLLIFASKRQIPEGVSSFSKKLKLPTKGIIGKLMESIKELLP